MQISSIGPSFTGERQRIVGGSAYQVLDSRGNPTVAAEIRLQDGTQSIAFSPSGASTGVHEALELRDGIKDYYNGKSVTKAVLNAENIINKLVGFDASDQRMIDGAILELDGTDNKSNLGANATLAVSLAAAKAAAKSEGLEFHEHIAYLNEDANDKYLVSLGRPLDSIVMPVPMLNIINGGAHANNSLDIQEFMISPFGAENTQEAVRMSSEIFHELKSLLNKAGYSTAVGDEGGFAPNFTSQEEALDFIMKAIDNKGYSDRVGICLDVAASELYNEENGTYNFKKRNETFTKDELVNYYADLIKEYPSIVSIEDGMAEDDVEGWQLLTKKLGRKIQLVGDDNFVTNPERLADGIDKGIANAVLIKPNQIGTLSETLNTINLAHDYGYETVISHRSGETEDTSIASIAMGTHAGQIKTGSMSRTDRIAKYNQLLIDGKKAENFGYDVVYPGPETYASNNKVENKMCCYI